MLSNYKEKLYSIYKIQNKAYFRLLYAILQSLYTFLLRYRRVVYYVITVFTVVTCQRLPVVICHITNKQVCWTSLQSDQNLRGPYIARHQQLSINICCPRLTSAANPPAVAAAVARRDRRTDGQTDGRTFDSFMILTACSADRVIHK